MKQIKSGSFSGLARHRSLVGKQSISLGYVRTRNAELVQRYMDIAGRVTALVVGTFAIEMIMRGLTTWMASVR